MSSMAGWTDRGKGKKEFKDKATSTSCNIAAELVGKPGARGRRRPLEKKQKKTEVGHKLIAPVSSVPLQLHYR